MNVRVMRDDLRPPTSPPRRHLISVADLSRDDVERLLATAASFETSLDREVKKLPTLRGRLVVTLFFESSTRTSSSFAGHSAPEPNPQQRTLRCEECGEMNYPTEWYCERCGGELAAM